MIGNTWLTHFLQCVLPIGLYNETPEDFYKMLDIQAKKFEELFWKGVDINNQRFFVCCIGVKSDAPFLAKSGMFLRSFSRRPTRASSRTAAAGVCHLCCAGKEDYEVDVPFEEYGALSPVWLQTCGVLKPYLERSPLLQIPSEASGTTEKLWNFDLFHNWHSGMGKYFSSSAVVVCLELVQDSIEGAFAQLTADFRVYCTRNHESPYHKKLTSTMFRVNQSFLDWPDAAWSKGDFTRLICKWFEDWCRRHVDEKTDDPLYLKCVALVWVFNQFWFEFVLVWGWYFHNGCVWFFYLTCCVLCWGWSREGHQLVSIRTLSKWGFHSKWPSCPNRWSRFDLLAFVCWDGQNGLLKRSAEVPFGAQGPLLTPHVSEFVVRSPRASVAHVAADLCGTNAGGLYR